MKEFIKAKSEPTPDLDNFKELKEKFDAVASYLFIEGITCLSPDLAGLKKTDITPPASNRIFHVTNTLGPAVLI